METKITELRAEKVSLQTEVREVKKANEVKFAEYARLSSALVKLGEFLKGGITHYFLTQYDTPKILTVEETISSDDWDKRKGKLLSLSPSGKSRRGLVWKLNTYTDGSGSDSECTPCLSYGEAQSLAQQWLNQQIAKGSYNRKYLKFARKHELDLPRGYVAAVISKERSELKAQEQSVVKKTAVQRKQKEGEWEALKAAEYSTGD